LAYKKGLSLRDSSLEIQKRKLMQYLFYRGWESHLIYEKIKALPFIETEA
jgi:regulatory protein